MTYPTPILVNLPWGFYGEKYQNRKSMDAAVRAYLEDLDSNFHWNPSEIVYPFRQIAILHEYWVFGEDGEAEEEKEEILVLESEALEGFTALDLLWQTHNAVVVHLNSVDHHFFEGFHLLEGEEHEDMPLYYISLGS